MEPGLEATPPDPRWQASILEQTGADGGSGDTRQPLAAGPGPRSAEA